MARKVHKCPSCFQSVEWQQVSAEGTRENWPTMYQMTNDAVCPYTVSTHTSLCVSTGACASRRQRVTTTCFCLNNGFYEPKVAQN